MADVTSIPAEQLGVGSPIRTEILETEQDLYHDMVRTMLNAVRANDAIGKPTVFILPVGPVGQYRRMARVCNLERISLHNLLPSTWTNISPRRGSGCPSGIR